MQIILLSGGSGKRLWPLSNGVRSKQFLRLLPGPDGTPESMTQRVVRQIAESGMLENATQPSGSGIVVATSASQRDALMNQLGDRVEIVTEPERRDTFPAIALSTTWLHSVKGCSRDETVVVMPCDPYTEAGYFRTVKRMAEAVENGAADLVLMGIRPTCPSTKFGYIVPAPGAQTDILPVARFTEKPDAARAARLLEEGALWNGGVFAFRLGYLLDALKSYLPDAAGFEQVHARYGELPKISFDYEIVEKARSVAAVPFSGEWKDLGTWNALTEELVSESTGNVILGRHTENTHVVNELDLLVLCEGVKDLIVAANSDGILVCGKEHSEGIKEYVDRLNVRPMYEERRWGYYKVLGQTDYEDGHRSLTKLLHLNAGCSISYQTHARREEVWTFVDGEGLLALDGRIKKVGRGDVAHIRRGELHAVKALTDLEIIEVQSGDELVEEDIRRFDWNWPEM